MTTLTLIKAREIIAAAMGKGKELSLKPLSVVVLDPGGHPIAFERADGASAGRYAIAVGKASGALQLGVSSRVVGDMAAERPAFVGSLASILPHGAIPAAGGILLGNSEGALIGAVGITGDTSDNDELCAITGAKLAGLTVL